MTGFSLSQKVDASLRESGAVCRDLIASLGSKYFFYAYDVNGVFTYVSPSVRHILGYEPAEFITHYSEHLADNPFTGDLGKYSQAASCAEKSSPYEIEIQGKDGAPHWLELVKLPVIDEFGAMVAVEGVAHDITSRKITEETLKRREQDLATAQHVGNMGSWTWDIQTDRVEWSAELFRLFGYEQNAVEPSFERFFQIVHPDDRPRIKSAFKAALGESAKHREEFRIIRPDSSVRWWLGRCEVQRDDSGEPVRMIGTGLDITERKHFEQALCKSENRLRATIEAEPECVKLLDASGTIQEMNPAGIAMLEAASADQVLGRSVYQVITEPYREAFAKELARVFSGETSRLEFDIAGFSGNILNVEQTAAPLRDDTGKIYAALAVTRDLTGRKQAEEARRKSAAQLKKALVQTIQSIAMTLEKRDPYTAGHQQRVAGLAAAIGTEMGLSEAEVEGIRLGGYIHDIGKVSAPAEILNRPGRLSEIEFALIKSHVQVGYEIIKAIEFPWPVSKMILQHHERLDGSGYPHGLKGDEIILEARIIAVADVVESMTSHRPYRPALGLDVALDEIRRGRGTLFDSEAVDACLKLCKEKGYHCEQEHPISA